MRMLFIVFLLCMLHAIFGYHDPAIKKDISSSSVAANINFVDRIKVSTIAGTSRSLTIDGTGRGASFPRPNAIQISPDATFLIVVDFLYANSQALRMVNLADLSVTTIIQGKFPEVFIYSQIFIYG